MRTKANEMSESVLYCLLPLFFCALIAVMMRNNPILPF